MYNPFKIGDYVECVSVGASDQIANGYYYRICDTDNSQHKVRITNNSGNCYWYHSKFFKLMPTPEQHVKEFLKRLEYVLDKDSTVASSLGFTRHIHYGDPTLLLASDISDIKGVDDIYTYINNSYDQLTSQAVQKRKLELLDKKAKLDVELAEINKELEGL